MHHTSIMQNQATDRFHLIFYKASPLPGHHPDIGETCRHTAQSYQADGCDTIDEAISLIEERDELWPTGVIEQWDGVESPANAAFFPYLTPRADVSWPILSTMARSSVTSA